MKKRKNIGASNSSEMVAVIGNDRANHDTEHGFKRRWLVSNPVCGSQNIAMAFGCLPPGVTATLHSHPYDTAIFIVAGGGIVQWGESGDRFTEFNSGDGIFIPAGVPHAPINDRDVEMLYVVARPVGIED